MTDRIFHQIPQNLPERRRIRAHLLGIGGDVGANHDVLFVSGRSDRTHDIGDHIRHPQRHGIRAPAAGLDPAQVQQVVHNALHPPCVRQDGLQKRLPAHQRDVAILDQRFGIAAHNGQRRAQFVAHVGHEVATHLLEFADRREIVHGEDGTAVRQWACHQ